MTKEFNDAQGLHPNLHHQEMLYIKNAVKAENIHIGEFTYYDTQNKTADFETENILYNQPGHGDLYIGKFTSIAYGVEIVMGAANHSLASFSTYPFCLISDNWASRLGMGKEDMPNKGDTIIGNDVWIGRKARIMPGVHIGDGAVIGSYSIVTKDIPPYCIAAGNPARIIRLRFDEETIRFLTDIKWWDFSPELVEEAVYYLSTVDIQHAVIKLKEIADKNKANNR